MSEGTILGMFIVTWGQIAGLYFYVGKIIGRIEKMNGVKREKRL